MPVIALVLLLAFVVLASIAVLPLSLVQRYRVGRARRPARNWLVTLNLVGVGVSTGIIVLASALTSVWVSDVLTYTLVGTAAGWLLGLAGLMLTRWESTPGALYYTPNRWLVLGITLIVTGRVFYGFWRSWQAWGAGLEHSSWSSWGATAGVAGSMGAAAVVLGHYLIYWLGVRRRLKRR